MDYDAILLDAGGVLLLPDVEVIASALEGAGITIDADQERMFRAHYAGMRAIDDAPADDDGRAYVLAMLAALGVPNEQREAAAQAIGAAWSQPASEVWRAVPPGTLEGLGALEATGVELAIVSNSDGTVEESLRQLGLCQVGEGGGVGMCIVVDSFVVEVEKPKPEIFSHALSAAGSAPERTLHVGDGVRYDVEGARAAGIAPMHFDPFSLCTATDHPHVASLGDLAAALRSAA